MKFLSTVPFLVLLLVPSFCVEDGTSTQMNDDHLVLSTSSESIPTENPPLLIKAGRCPSTGMLEQWQCRGQKDQCNSDNDCGGEAKCCSTGCNKVCVHPALSACEQQRAATVRRARALGPLGNDVSLPNCSEDGSFFEIQCNRADGLCWCVDQAGLERAGTRARALDLVNCSNPRPCLGHMCRMLCPFDFELDVDGCPLCACRDPCRGVRCPGNTACEVEEVPCEREPCAPVPTCKQPRSLSTLCPVGEPIIIPESGRPFLCGSDPGKPRCPDLHDCHVQPGHDYGVCCAAANRMQKPGACPSPTTNNNCGSTCDHDLQCTGEDKCCHSDQCGKHCIQPANSTACLQQQMLSELLSVNEHEGKGYIPQCSASGEFLHRQCSRNGLVCWCVDPSLGHKSPRSMGPAHRVNCNEPTPQATVNSPVTGRKLCDHVSCSVACEYGYKLDEAGCATCQCDDPCDSFSCSEDSECVIVTDESCSSSATNSCPAAPRCRPRALYVNPCELGVPLTEERTGVVIACSPAQGGPGTCPSGHECVLASVNKDGVCCQKRKRIVCEYLRDMASNVEGSTLGFSLAVPVPTCNSDGSFAATLCHNATGKCWCVDEFGTEIPDTKAAVGEPMQCEAIRADMQCLGVLCKLGCDYGFRLNSRTGCPMCECCDPCEGSICSNGSHCEMIDVECIDGHCPPVPLCVPSEDTSARNNNNLCPNGRHPFYETGSNVPVLCSSRSRVLQCPTDHYCYQEEGSEEEEDGVAEDGFCCPIVEDSLEDDVSSEVSLERKNVVTSKEGQCPYLIAPSAGNCESECSEDTDCSGANKCCSHGCGMKCVKPQLFTGCQHHRKVLEHQARESGVPAGRVFLPMCRIDNGLHEPIQCHPATGMCWCVSDDGKEIPGTRVQESKTPNCKAPMTCPQITCSLRCPQGHKLDESGCPLCDCNNPCQTVSCSSDREECRLVKVACKGEPCPPVAICLPRLDNPCTTGRPLLTAHSNETVFCNGNNLDCPSSYQCHVSPFGEYAVCCPKTREVCSQKIEEGPCRAVIKRWAFKTETNSCEEFTYSGCRGNSNNFATKDECMSTCPVLSGCERLREKNMQTATKLKRPSFIPKCSRLTGAWEQIQCLEEVGLCWCVTKNGDPLPGSLTRGTPVCNYRKARTQLVEQRICPEGQVVHSCDNLCHGRVCLAFPNATCRVDPCGSCRPAFYDEKNHEVDCYHGLSRCQAERQTKLNSFSHPLSLHLFNNEEFAEEENRLDKGLFARTLFDEDDLEADDLIGMPSSSVAVWSGRSLPITSSVDTAAGQLPFEFTFQASASGQGPITVHKTNSHAGFLLPLMERLNKPGNCPLPRLASLLHVLMGTCQDQCFLDSDCSGPKKCCMGDCGLHCLIPIDAPLPTVRDGQCPNTVDMELQCDQYKSCLYDTNCGSEEKCCFTDCGAVCLPYPKDGSNQGDSTATAESLWQSTTLSLGLPPVTMAAFSPTCTEEGSYELVQRQGELSWCVDSNGNPLHHTLTRGTVHCTENGTVQATHSIGPVCNNPGETPLVCVDACLTTKCPARPQAECRADPCNNCKTEFYDQSGHVVQCGNRCTKSLEVGSCNAKLRRYFFDSDSGQCEPFLYSGCNGNSNRFETLEECQEDCGHTDTCNQPLWPGHCRALLEHWFYNKETFHCEPFIYGGCGGNSNNFPTKEACEGRCPDIVLCPKLEAGNAPAVCSRSEACANHTCHGKKGVICHVDPCNCAVTYTLEKKGETTNCMDELVENKEVTEQTHIQEQTPETTTITTTTTMKASSSTSSPSTTSTSTTTTTESIMNNMALPGVKTRCNDQRDKALGKTQTHYVPECDNKGRFLPTQCFHGKNRKLTECWCVDEAGNQLPHSSTFSWGSQYCGLVPVKAVRVTLGIPLSSNLIPESFNLQSEVESLLTAMEARTMEEGVRVEQREQGPTLLRFTLMGENKVDVAFQLQEMIKSGSLSLHTPQGIIPVDLGLSHFHHEIPDGLAIPLLTKMERGRSNPLGGDGILAQVVHGESNTQQISVIISSIVAVLGVCVGLALILLTMRRKKKTSFYPKEAFAALNFHTQLYGSEEKKFPPEPEKDYQPFSLSVIEHEYGGKVQESSTAPIHKSKGSQ